MVDSTNKIERTPESENRRANFEKIAQRSPDQNVNELYDKLGGDGYDVFVKEINFNEPAEFMKMVGAGQVVDIDPASEVLDVGAGTGICGNLLKEKGFANVTGVDPSQALLDKLAASGAYKATRCMYLGLGLDKYPDDLKGKFDLVTAGGVFLVGHIPPVGFEDCHASLKTNGYFVTGMRTAYWSGEQEGYRAKIDEMIAAGNFKLIHTTTSIRGRKGETGIYGEQESTLIVLQRVD